MLVLSRVGVVLPIRNFRPVLYAQPQVLLVFRNNVMVCIVSFYSLTESALFCTQHKLWLDQDRRDQSTKTDQKDIGSNFIKRRPTIMFLWFSQLLVWVDLARYTLKSDTLEMCLQNHKLSFLFTP